MKKTVKLLSVVLVLTMIIGLIPTSVLALKIDGTDDIYTDDPNGVKFDTPLQVGVLYEDEIRTTDPYIEVDSGSISWSGYAKSFTVTLDGFTDYTIDAYVECDDAYYVDRAIAVYYEGELGYSTEKWEYANALDGSLSFRSYLPGEYQILVWGYCDDDEDETLFDNTYFSLLIDETGLRMFDDEIAVGSSNEITLEDSDPYYDVFGSYGYGYGFHTNFEQGKYYLITVEATADESIAADDISPYLFLGESVDGEVISGTYGYDKLSYVVRADRTGSYNFLFLGEAWDRTTEEYIYGDLMLYNISVKKVTPTYFDIDCEEDYIEFIDDLYFRSYEDSVVVASIYGDLDFTDNEYWYGVDSNASAIYIDGIGDTIIEGITDALIYDAQMVFVENITINADLYFDDIDDLYNVGLLVGWAKFAKITNCNAYGSITVSSVVYAEEIGGLVGGAFAVEIVDAEVEVDIITIDTETVDYVGGVCGYSDVIRASNVSYKGDIIANAPDRFYYIGGFVGRIYNDSIFENCTVSGVIKYNGNPTTLEYYVEEIGGFAGYIEDYNVFYNCNANTTVYTIYGNYIGGFAGCIDEANEFYNCYAYGGVTGYYVVGGFVGDSSCCGYNTFANCYSVGLVNGNDNVGGFIGCSYDADAFVNCYAYGRVMCNESETEETCIGTFVGYIYYENSFENVYARDSVLYSTVGDSGYDVTEIISTNFNDSNAVDEIVTAMNQYVNESNNTGFVDYKLFKWSADNDEGIPKFIEEPDYIIGDANLDGTVDSLDYLLVKRHCFNTVTLEGDAFKASDINGDGNIDSSDYLLVKRICFGTYVVA